MRYAILGAGGQLGREFVQRLGADAAALTRAEADLTDLERLRNTLDAVAPEVVINCAAYNFVDRAEKESAAAFAVNAWGVRELASLCAARGWTLVHFSTDYVFGLDADRAEPFAETDPPGPVGIYGLSKLTGEYLIRATCPRHFVIRTCGLYGLWGSGGKGGNFVETMLRLAGEGKPIRVVADQVCTPTAASDLADAVLRLLALEVPGVYHLTNAGACSWHEFASAIFEFEGLTPDLTRTTSMAFGSTARRPAYSVLANRATERLGLPPLRPWRVALADYLRARQVFRAGDL
jgi:dTDP-4-dehydrorhamnose reductase